MFKRCLPSRAGIFTGIEPRAVLSSLRFGRAPASTSASHDKNILTKAAKNLEQPKGVDGFFKYVSALAEEVKNPEVLVPLYHIPNHRRILGEMLSHAEDLVAGSNFGKDAVGSAVVTGSKGIGKSTCLETFIKIYPVAFPEVKMVPIYISFINANVCDRPLADIVWEGVVAELGSRIPAFTEPSRPSRITMTDVLQLLLRPYDFYLFLVADELEKLFEINPQSDSRGCGIALSTLKALSEMGASHGGRYVTYACGSSTSLVKLMTKKYTPDARFPLSGTPHMNGTKFPAIRLKPSLPTDFETIRTMLESECKTSVPDTTIRMTAFMVGCNARALNGYLRMLKSLNQETPPPELGNKFRTFTLYDTEVAEGTWNIYGSLVIDIHHAMLRANFHLLKDVCNQSLWQRVRAFFSLPIELPWQPNVDISQVPNVDWSKWKPLSRKDLDALLQKHKLHEDVAKTISFLEDRSWIIGDREGHTGISLSFYPASFFNVVLASEFSVHSLQKLKAERWETYMKDLKHLLLTNALPLIHALQFINGFPPIKP